ncbi:hypothetical protein BJX61DRAFT_215208 [Aspergillus egyptiacus]|nr:hypothetical protein BJX61DRAFT_215208 [Aspergillus egyptiacus]
MWLLPKSRLTDHRIYDGLDKKSRGALADDPSNPRDGVLEPVTQSGNAPHGSSAAIARQAAGRRNANTSPTRANAGPARTVPPHVASTTDHYHRPPTSRAVPTGSNTSSLTSAPMRPGVTKPRQAPAEVARPATAAGFVVKQPDTPTKGSPSRKTEAHPTSPSKIPLPPSTRPRQKSDPLQDASPTKQRKIVDVRDSPTGSPCQTIHIPKRRLKSQEAIEKSNEQTSKDVSDETCNDQTGTPEPGSTKADMRRASQILRLLPEWPKTEETSENDSAVDDTNASPAMEVDEASSSYTGDLKEPSDVNSSATPLTDFANASTSAAAPDTPMTAPVPALRFDQIPNLQVTGERKTSFRWKRLDTPVKRRNISPRSQDPVQARAMLAKGIERVQDGTMDILGYRKLQGLIRYHESANTSLFVDEDQFDSLLHALFCRLRIMPMRLYPAVGSEWDLRTQILNTIRDMFSVEAYFSDHCIRALLALIDVHGIYHGTQNHLLMGIEELIEGLISYAEPIDIVTTILETLDYEATDDYEFKRLVAGVQVLTKTLAYMDYTNSELPPEDGRRLKLPESTLERLGEFAARTITVGFLDVRQSIVALSTRLHPLTSGKEQFWDVLDLDEEETNRVVSYYNYKVGNDV